MAYPKTRTDIQSWALIPAGSAIQDFLHEVSLRNDFSKYVEIASNALFLEADAVTILLSGGFND